MVGNNKFFEMKNKNILLLILILGVAFVSCELDDRNGMLEAGFEGTLIDNLTGKMVQTDHTGNRAKLCFIDEAYGEDAQKIEYNILPEGKYSNTKVYPSTYTIYAKGPFIETDTMRNVKMNGHKKFDLKVMPYLTISIVKQEVVKGKMRVTYSYKLNTDDAEVKVKEVNLYYSKYPYPGNADVDNKNVFKIKNTPTDREGEFTEEFYLEEGVIMYVRAGGTVNAKSDYYNYSDSFETPLEFEPATEEKMDRGNWTVHDFSSEEPAEGNGNGVVTAVFDGDLGTFWHSAWAETSPDYPHHFSINIGETKEITGFECARRQGNSGGPTKIQMLVSSDGKNWIDLGTFDFDGTSDAVQKFDVEHTKMNYFKFVALEGPYNYAFLAEINLYVSR
ncbi:DUF3823 domain-containing protein [Marinilabiliaceae bacterium JC017]|nr:DUF3823 domain-containing protein [Marinilabiliaceae bacterium JC017]